MSESSYDFDKYKERADELVLKSLENAKTNKIRMCDMTTVLPDEIRERVRAIVEYPFDEDDREVFIEDSTVEMPKDETRDTEDSEEEKIKARKTFNESTCSEIERQEIDFPHFAMRLDSPMKRKERVKKLKNWFTHYVCKTRRERVLWDSKIYQLDRKMNEKSLDEQAEQLMDTSAFRFTEWMNALGSTDDSNMTKDELKDLFTIGGDSRILASIQTDPKEVKAIAKTVADKWHLPDMAIELKYNNTIQHRLDTLPTTIRKVIFGKTVPENKLPWLPTSANDQPVLTIFPEQLLTYEKLFKGITHLRSTKTLVRFYRDRPRIPRPGFLIELGMFDSKMSQGSDLEMPLYDQLKLTY